MVTSTVTENVVRDATVVNEDGTMQQRTVKGVYLEGLYWHGTVRVGRQVRAVNRRRHSRFWRFDAV